MYVVVLFLRDRPQDRVFIEDLRPYWDNAKGYFSYPFLIEKAVKICKRQGQGFYTFAKNYNIIILN